MSSTKKQLILSTVGMISIGVAGLALLTTPVKGQILKSLSTEAESPEVVKNTETAAEEILSDTETAAEEILSDTETAAEEILPNTETAAEEILPNAESEDTEPEAETTSADSADIGRDKQENADSNTFVALNSNSSDLLANDSKNTTDSFGEMKEVFFSYKGCEITVYDNMVDQETAKSNAREAIDIVFEELQRKLLDQLGIHAENYDFNLTRQLQYPDQENYAIGFLENDRIQISVLVNIDDHSICGFTRDGLVDLKRNELLPKEYRAENWAVTDEQKREVYEEYLPLAKDILKNTLHLPEIKETEFDPADERYMIIDDSWSNVGFGYQLENGMFIRLIFNRANQEWDGFVFLGYDAELLNNSVQNRTDEGIAVLKQYGFYKYFLEK